MAYLLDSRDVLTEMSKDENAVLRRWAYDLRGVRGGEADRLPASPELAHGFCRLAQPPWPMLSSPLDVSLGFVWVADRPWVWVSAS